MEFLCMVQNNVPFLPREICSPQPEFFASRTDVAGTSMGYGNTVRSWHTYDAPSFHYTLKDAIDSVDM